ncbi:hypothetical protein [Azoarcus indigens]|nr:hypothetical protein [Azoarcus indigens]
MRAGQQACPHLHAVLRDHAAYGNPRPRPDKKLERTAFAIAA